MIYDLRFLKWEVPARVGADGRGPSLKGTEASRHRFPGYTAAHHEMGFRMPVIARDRGTQGAAISESP